MNRPGVIPLEALFADSVFCAPRISPDGGKIAYLSPNEGVPNVWVRSTRSNETTCLTTSKTPISGLRWCPDGRTLLYRTDNNGDENWHIWALDVTTGEREDLTPFGPVYSQIIGAAKEPTRVVLEINRDDPMLHDAYVANLVEGTLDLIESNPGNVSAMQPDQPGWFVDGQLAVRGRVVANDDASYDLMVRSSTEADWVTVHHFDFEDTRSSKPLRFSRDGNSFYAISSKDAPTGRLVSIDNASHRVDVIAADPSYDVEHVLFEISTGEPIAVAYNRDRLEWQTLAERFEETFQTLSTINKGDFTIESRSADDSIWIVMYQSDLESPVYYMLDRGNGEASLIGEGFPSLRAHQTTPVEPFEFKARDGMVLHGYVAFPPGRERRNLPMILVPHGGPWGRDSWVFNPRIQWLANRGYLSLQVNFRGSTGYGKTLVNAGNKQWGGKMHDDLIDAVDWMVKSSFADPRRVGVLGGSYGGYAALCCGAFTPDVFACAIELYGWSDLVVALEKLTDYWMPRAAQWYRRVGDPMQERDLLWSRSPLSRVGDWRIPAFVAHGAKDARVKKEASDVFVNALRELQDVEYVVYEDEGHGFLKTKNRFDFYRRAESFLGKHLPAD